MKSEKYNKIFESIEQDIDLIDDTVNFLKDNRKLSDNFHIRIAELLKAKALLITAYNTFDRNWSIINGSR